MEESQGEQEAVSPLFWKECDMRRRSEVLVTEFLRDALAVDAVVKRLIAENPHLAAEISCLN